jgi:hypothetical protein
MRQVENHFLEKEVGMSSNNSKVVNVLTRIWKLLWDHWDKGFGFLGVSGQAGFTEEVTIELSVRGAVLHQRNSTYENQL